MLLPFCDSENKEKFDFFCQKITYANENKKSKIYEK